MVDDNLRHAFPELSIEDRKKLAKQFYKHFADLVIESIKLLTISQKELNRRCKIADTEGARNLFSQKKGSILLTAHFGNWEWGGEVVGLRTEKPVQVVYKILKSKPFEIIMRKIRTRFGNEAIPMESAYRSLVQKKNEGVIGCFVADQTPMPHPSNHWTLFMNRMAPFFNGAEKIASKLDFNVYFVKIVKERRGFYHLEIDLMTDEPAKLEAGEITEDYAKRLEKSIKKQPFTYLWSHRRWKHDYPGEKPKPEARKI